MDGTGITVRAGMAAILVLIVALSATVGLVVADRTSLDPELKICRS